MSDSAKKIANSQIDHRGKIYFPLLKISSILRIISTYSYLIEPLSEGTLVLVIVEVGNAIRIADFIKGRLSSNLNVQIDEIGDREINSMDSMEAIDPENLFNFLKKHTRRSFPYCHIM